MEHGTGEITQDFNTKFQRRTALEMEILCVQCWMEKDEKKDK